jgi:tetratricopeptide (TPR) repeat protein
MHDRRFDIALREIGAAQRLDPRGASILANKGLILFHAGRVDEALAILRPLAETEPRLLSPHAYLATIYLATTRYQDFLREYRQAATLSGNASALAIADASESAFSGGDGRPMLAAMFAEQKRQYAADREPAFKLALTAAMLGDTGAALDYLEASIKRHEQDILGIRLEPALASLQNEKRYLDMVAQVGFSVE